MSYDNPISYSGLSLYRKCPLAWKTAYIDGVRTESGAAANRGTKIHAELEKYFDGTSPELRNLVFQPWKDWMEELLDRATVLQTEWQVGATKDWGKAAFDDPQAHVRGAMDLVVEADDELPHVIDWKTGGIYPEHVGQADYYAALRGAYHLRDGVEVSMVYLDHPKTVRTWQYGLDKVQELQGSLNDEIAILRLDEEYVPTPSPKSCRWCPKSWRAGGDCKAAP